MPPEHKASCTGRLTCIQGDAKERHIVGFGSAVLRRESMGLGLNHSTKNQEVSWAASKAA